MKKINIPKFKNESQERAFWQKIDLSKYFKEDDFEHASFPNLKATSRAISLRLPEYIIIRLKEQANELSIPYQSLMKKYIAQGIAKERAGQEAI